MSNSSGFRTRHLGKFNRTYKILVKTHYRKNRKAKDDFEKLVARYISLLGSDPRPPLPFGGMEPWPGGGHREGWELRKLHFDMPGLRGAAGEGRLIYMVDTRGSVVYLLWIYTHAEFEGRPPNKSLRQLTEEARREAENQG